MKVIKIVTFPDVETWTMQGWEFVQVVPHAAEALFLLSKDGEDVSRDAVLEGKLNLAVAEGRKLQEQLNAMTYKHGYAQERVVECQERFNSLNASFTALQAYSNKLEGALSKVRVAFGSKAYEDALK